MPASFHVGPIRPHPNCAVWTGAPNFSAPFNCKARAKCSNSSSLGVACNSGPLWSHSSEKGGLDGLAGQEVGGLDCFRGVLRSAAIARGLWVLIVAFGLRLLLYSPKYALETNQVLDLKVETAKQRIRIVATRGMGYNNMWDWSTKTMLCIDIASPLSHACMLRIHRAYGRKWLNLKTMPNEKIVKQPIKNQIPHIENRWNIIFYVLK